MKKIERIDKGNIGNRTFYAKWILEKFNINLNVNSNYTDFISAEIESTNSAIFYNQHYKLPVPQIKGFVFIGWFDSNNQNIKYTNEYGESLGVYLDEQDIDLIAIWSREKYYIQININGQYKWLTKNGEDFNFSDTKDYVEYNKNLCPNCNIKAQIEKSGEQASVIKNYLFKEGHVFKNMIFDKNDSSSIACWHDIDDDYSDGEVIEIFADYRVETNFKIYLKNEETNAYTKILEANYGDLLNFESFPTKTGYTFKEFIVDENYEEKYNGKYVGTHLAPGLVFYTYNPNLLQVMPDLSIGIELDGSDIYLKAVFTPNEYNVNFTGANESINSLVVTFGKAYNSSNNNALPVPIKTGYNFVGWYLDLNDSITKITDEKGNVNNWEVPYDCTLIAQWEPKKYEITFDFCGGDGKISNVIVTYGEYLPSVQAPTRTGYIFAGYYEFSEGKGIQYYSSNMISSQLWDLTENKTLYAKWIAITYEVTLVKNGGSGGTDSFKVTYDSALPTNLVAPKRMGYFFEGYYSENNGNGTCYINSQMKCEQDWNFTKNITLYAYWKIRTRSFNCYYLYTDGNGYSSLNSNHYTLQGGNSITLSALTFEGYNFVRWELVGSEGSLGLNPNTGRKTTVDMGSALQLTINFDVLKVVDQHTYIGVYAYYEKDNCVAEGTMITLADGSQKAVEELTGNEMLLVWNMMTGKFDVAPILFIDKDVRTTYEVINLYFSDGTSVKVISEHAFWDFDLNEYVFLRNDAVKYIGHWFNKQILDSDGNMTWTKVQLTNVEVKKEITTAYSPVTYGHLCYYVNGMLSMPGATEGLINIFEVDSETMIISEEAMKADIEKYGLYTYEEFAEIMPIPDEIFNAFNGQYLKISIGKGLISINELKELINKYSEFFQ